MKMISSYFYIALTLLLHSVIIPMETEQKKPIVSREIVFQKWLEKKINTQTTPETLTPEGLAYILYCFPPEMLYEIARWLKAPAHRLVPYIKQHLHSEKKESVYNSHLYTISSAAWVPSSKILNVIIESERQEVDPLIFRFAGSKPMPIHFTRSHVMEDGISLSELDHRDPNCTIVQCLIRETTRSVPTLRRFVRSENEFIILCTNVRVYEAHNIETHVLYFMEAFRIGALPLFAFSDHIQRTPQAQSLLLREKLFLQADWPRADWSIDDVHMNEIIDGKLVALASNFCPEITAAAAPKESSSDDDN